MSSTSFLKKVQASLSMILGVFVLSSASVSAFAQSANNCSTGAPTTHATCTTANNAAGHTITPATDNTTDPTDTTPTTTS